MYPLLSLSHISINLELARRLSRKLAYYHLALPIAQDEDNITLAMAYPENHRVVEVIQTALGMPVTPVRSHAADIRRVLDTIWIDEGENRQSGLMGWTVNPDDKSALEMYAQSLMTALSLEETLSFSHAPVAQFIAQANELCPKLAICVATDPEICRMLISNISSSLLLLRGAFVLPHRILHALRGHTPDQHVLDWVLQFAQHYDASVTLLAAASSITAPHGSQLMSDVAQLILPEHPAQVIEYGQMLASMNIRGRIKVANGLLSDILVETLEATSYDLVAIATENDGRFVQSVLARLSGNSSAFLVIKP